MYIPRLLTPAVKRAVKLFPAVLITGPRQSGKTTFLLEEFKHDASYISFDDPLQREFARQDPNRFLDRSGDKPLIIDEMQYVPEILPYIKMRIDKKRDRTGAWLLTGSQQFHLMKNISESLAGRIAIFELLPFSLIEYKEKKKIEDLIWNGGYPEPSLNPEKRGVWIRSYIQTYIERDIRQLQNIKDMRTFESFVGLLAAHHAQVLNASTLSRECGVSVPTIKSWLGVLEASYLCTFLPPYYKNYGKRLIKSPKLYFIDPAIVCELTRQPDKLSAVSGAMAGALFEGLIVGEAIKIFASTGKGRNLFFWRSHDGLEVDLIIRIDRKMYPVEIKLTATPSAGHVQAIEKFKLLAGKDASDTGLLVCGVEREVDMPGNNKAIPWFRFPEWLQSRVKA